MSITSRARLRAPRPMQAIHRDRTRAQALVEFALIVPVFLFLVVVAVDFGRLFFSYVQVNNGAREGAAYGASSPTDTIGINASVQTEVNVQAQRGEGAMTVTQACADSVGTSIACTAATGGAGPGNTITVSVSRRFSFLTPLIDGFFGNNLQMSASATATVLGYAPGSGASQPRAAPIRRRPSPSSSPPGCRSSRTRPGRPRTAASATSPVTTGSGAIPRATSGPRPAITTPTARPEPTPSSSR